ncbi:MAG: hypothetical protein PUB22_09200 [Clostridiales bacterium]|nr:hypothetical protein [Clostridiales bacterium]
MRRSKIKSTIMATALAVILAAQPVMAAGMELSDVTGAVGTVESKAAGRSAEYASVITEQFIEVGYEAGKAPESVLAEDFTVVVNGEKKAFTVDAYFEDKATLKLEEALVNPEEASVVVTETKSEQELKADWDPWYTFTETLGSDSVAVRKNQGTKSKLWVLGNENSGCEDKNAQYTAEYVIQYCAEGINKVAGRSDFLTLAASHSDLRIVVVGSGESVYDVPEYRHLYNAEDAYTRVTIPGTRELPIIVTTAEDVMRQKDSNNNTFELLYDFAKLYWELGVIDGVPMFALSVYDDENTYNYVKHLETAYENAKEKNLWPGTKMMESKEEYFAYATMVWYEGIEESSDGSWQYENFPVNTRSEMLQYDEELYGVMVEIYGEFEYFSGYREQHTVNTDGQILIDFPWYKHSQVDNYDINGKAYDPLYVTECNLISANQIELVFNREIRDLDELRNGELWTINWTDKDGNVNTYTGSGLTCQFYQWKTLTLQVRGIKMYDGYIGSDVKGFTAEEVAEAADPESDGYRPWFTENAYNRSLDGKTVSPQLYNSLSEEDREGVTVAEAFTVAASESAIENGTYVNFADESTVPDYLKSGINGTITVQYSGTAKDWADNSLTNEPISVKFRPWMSQVMRSEKTGVYVYGDPYVEKSSLAAACEYWDLMLSQEDDNIGQRIADGLAYKGGGAELMSYHHHAYQMSGKRNTYGAQNHFYLYVEGFGGGICQTTEFNVTRDYTYTRYDNEFIMGHEGAHSIEITGMPCFTDLNYTVQKAYTDSVTTNDLWNNGGYSYAGSNRAEYYATLANIWHGTMRESTDGSNNGTWLSINTREELYEYDRNGYEMAKHVYYNGHVGVDVDAVNEALANGTLSIVDEEGNPITTFTERTYVPGWDKDGNSINDDIIKWGGTFPANLMKAEDEKLSEIYGDAAYFRWVSWSCANQWDINDSHDPSSGINYGYDDSARYDKVNYNPFLVSADAPTKDEQTITFDEAAPIVVYEAGKTIALNAVSTGDGELTYTTSDAAVATVDEDGVITLQGVGEVTITITAAETEEYLAAETSVSFKVSYLAPILKEDLTVTNSILGVSLKWTKVKGASGYYVYRKSGDKDWKVIGTVYGKKNVSFTDLTAKNGTEYSYCVRAFCKKGKYLGEGEAVNVVCLNSTFVLGLRNTAGKAVTVQWLKNTKADGYQIQYSTSYNFADAETVDVSGADTVCKSISGLEKGKIYYVRVRACKTVDGEENYSAWSLARAVRISK